MLNFLLYFSINHSLFALVDIGIPISKVKYFAMHKMQMHADAISMLIYGFAWVCICTEDNPVAIARGISFHKNAQTIQ